MYVLLVPVMHNKWSSNRSIEKKMAAVCVHYGCVFVCACQCTRHSPPPGPSIHLQFTQNVPICPHTFSSVNMFCSVFNPFSFSCSRLCFYFFLLWTQFEHRSQIWWLLQELLTVGALFVCLRGKRSVILTRGIAAFHNAAHCVHLSCFILPPGCFLIIFLTSQLCESSVKCHRLK